MQGPSTINCASSTERRPTTCDTYSALEDASRGLLAELDVVLDRHVLATKERFSGHVHARNIGTTPWNLVEAPVGVVPLGALLLAKDRDRDVDFDFLRRRVGETPRTSVEPGNDVFFGSNSNRRSMVGT